MELQIEEMQESLSELLRSVSILQSFLSMKFGSEFQEYFTKESTEFSQCEYINPETMKTVIEPDPLAIDNEDTGASSRISTRNSTLSPSEKVRKRLRKQVILPAREGASVDAIEVYEDFGDISSTCNEEQRPIHNPLFESAGNGNKASENPHVVDSCDETEVKLDFTVDDSDVGEDNQPTSDPLATTEEITDTKPFVLLSNDEDEVCYKDKKNEASHSQLDNSSKSEDSPNYMTESDEDSDDAPGPESQHLISLAVWKMNCEASKCKKMEDAKGKRRFNSSVSSSGAAKLPAQNKSGKPPPKKRKSFKSASIIQTSGSEGSLDENFATCHSVSHSNVKEYSLSCNICENTSFDSIQSRDRHISLVHFCSITVDDVELFNCVKCNMTTLDVEAALSHAKECQRHAEGVEDAKHNISLNPESLPSPSTRFRTKGRARNVNPK